MECVRFSAAFAGAGGHRSSPGANARQGAGRFARPRPSRRRLAFLRILRLVSCLLASAQPYATDWSTIDGGGGTSTGGGYSVRGTIGQPDAGTMSGSSFTPQGGFWPGIVVPSTGEVPTLFIQSAGDSVIVSWSPETSGFELEATADLTGGTWTAAPAGNPVPILTMGPTQFYRLRRP